MERDVCSDSGNMTDPSACSESVNLASSIQGFCRSIQQIQRLPVCHKVAQVLTDAMNDVLSHYNHAFKVVHSDTTFSSSNVESFQKQKYWMGLFRAQASENKTGHSFLLLSKTFLFLLSEKLLGAEIGEAVDDQAPFTAFERHISQKWFQCLVHALSDAFKPEPKTHFFEKATLASERVLETWNQEDYVVMQWSLGHWAHSTPIAFVFPAWFLDQMTPKSTGLSSKYQSDWMLYMKNVCLKTPLSLEALLDTQPVSLHLLMNSNVGDVIPLFSESQKPIVQCLLQGESLLKGHILPTHDALSVVLLPLSYGENPS